MSFWGKLFGRSISAAVGSTMGQSVFATENAARLLLSDETNKQFLHDSLERLEAAGLRIIPSLDRDLIVVRFFRGIADQYEAEELETFFEEGDSGARNSPDLKVFWQLTSETDAFYDFKQIGAVLPQLSESSDDLSSDIVDEHSRSIFENAATMSIVKEEGPESYVRDRVELLAELACGDFEIKSVTASSNSRQLVGKVTLSDGQSQSFGLIDEKRPDTTPFFKAMNSLVAHLDKGRFVVVSDGSSERLIVVYLHPDEQIAFRNWAERQYCVGGPAPIDWFE